MNNKRLLNGKLNNFLNPFALMESRTNNGYEELLRNSSPKNIVNRIIKDFDPVSIQNIGAVSKIFNEIFQYSESSKYTVDNHRILGEQQTVVLNSQTRKKEHKIIICEEILEKFQPSKLDEVIKYLSGPEIILILTFPLKQNKSIKKINADILNPLAEKLMRYGFVRLSGYDAGYIAPEAQVFQHISSQDISLTGQIENDLLFDSEEVLFYPEPQALSDKLNELISHESDKIDKKNKNSKPSEKGRLDNIKLKGVSEIKLWIREKRQRFAALYATATYIRRMHGLTAFARQMYLFGKGERHNSKNGCFNQATGIRNFEEVYENWIDENEPDQSALKHQKTGQSEFAYRPLISILTPVYNTDKIMLVKMVESVIAQTYENWELCIADGCSDKPYIRPLLEEFVRRDNRIKVKFLDINKGISGNTNECLDLAGGEFVALLDHDDELSRDSLYENISLLNQRPDADMIYSDEDKLDQQGKRCEPYFKPDWSPDLFCSSMYTCHFGIYRKKLVDEIGGFRPDFDGAQDYDLVLRLVEKTDKIYHIPKILYHWRKTKGSTALELRSKDYAKTAQIKAVTEHFQRRRIKAEILPGLTDNLLRVKRQLMTRQKISIIIPTHNQSEILKNCVNSIINLSTYDNYEIIIIDNNSSEDQTLAYFDEISRVQNIRVIKFPYPFNFSSINNFAVGHAKGDFLLFLNNDTEVISSEWLEAMAEHASRPEVGVVGARLLYPNGMVQHAGVITGIGGVAGHSHKFLSKDHPGYFSRAKAIQNYSAVTGACMMVRKDVFNSLGGFDEKNLSVAFNDVDLCLRARQKGLQVVYTPYAELYHHESLSRGEDQTPEKSLRFQGEVQYMLKTWGDILQKDPFYNPNLTMDKEDFSINIST